MSQLERVRSGRCQGMVLPVTTTEEDYLAANGHIMTNRVFVDALGEKRHDYSFSAWHSARCRYCDGSRCTEPLPDW